MHAVHFLGLLPITYLLDDLFFFVSRLDPHFVIMLNK